MTMPVMRVVASFLTMLPKNLTQGIQTGSQSCGRMGRLVTMLSTTFSIKIIFSFLSVLTFADKISAQGPPIYTDSPILLGLEGGAVRTFGKYISKKNATIYVHPFVVPYNLTAKLFIGVGTPYISKMPKGKDHQSGMGDVFAFAKYVILQKDKTGKTFRSAVKVSETFPTGKTNIGSGVYQTSVGIVNGYITTKYGIYGEVSYNIASDNLPDELIYNFAFGLPLLPQKYPPKQLNLYLEFTGDYIVDNKANNLFIAPGVQYIAGRRFLFEGGIQIPLAEDVPETQKTNFMYLLGTRILIF